MSSHNLQIITINDLNEICRLCPTKQNLIPLYKNPEIIQMLQYFTQLEYAENDGLPNKVCQSCVIKLADSYNFINLCKSINETYKKCIIEASEIKTEDICEVNIKEEDIPQVEEPEEPHQICQDEKVLQEFVRLGKQYGCNSIIMRYFTEKQGAEKLSMHVFMTSFMKTSLFCNYDIFMRFSRAQMTDDLCHAVSEETKNIKSSELCLELRYGRITSSKMYTISCCQNPDTYYVENVIGFYKMNETSNLRTNEVSVCKIEKQMNIKIRRCGLILCEEYPEFVSKVDGVTDDAVIKIKHPKNAKDIGKYVAKDGTLTPKIKSEMHLMMLMTNVKMGYLCLIDPNFANTSTVIKVDYNERYFTEILKKNQEFWKLRIFPILLQTVKP